MRFEYHSCWTEVNPATDNKVLNKLSYTRAPWVNNRTIHLTKWKCLVSIPSRKTARFLLWNENALWFPHFHFYMWILGSFHLIVWCTSMLCICTISHWQARTRRMCSVCACTGPQSQRGPQISESISWLLGLVGGRYTYYHGRLK